MKEVNKIIDCKNLLDQEDEYRRLKDSTDL